MPTSPTPITALPDAPNPDADETTFDNAAYAWSAALPNFRLQMNVLGSVTYTNTQEAAASAITATTQAGLATTNGAAQVTLAAAQVALATTQAGIATTKAIATTADAVATAADRVQTGLDRTAAAASAASAAALAGAFVGTSTSSVTIGSGNKTFITQAGEQYTTGVFMTAVSAANSANYMAGQVVSYSGTTLIISVSVTGGSGTFADWNLSIAGPQGATGPQGPQGPAIDYAVIAESVLIALPVTSAVSTLRHVVTIDANRVALIFSSTAALQGICYDHSTKIFGAGFLIRSGYFYSSAILSNTDKILVVSVIAGASAFEAVVLSFAGTAPTVNTAVPTTLPENASSIALNPAIVGGTFVFGLVMASSDRAIAVTVSGTTPSIGTPVVLPGYVAGASQITVRGIDSTRALATYTEGLNILFCPITMSAGTTLTPGTQASTAVNGSQFYGPYPLTTGRFAMPCYNGTNSYGLIVSVSGTVASVTTVLLNTGNVASCVKIGDRLLVKSNSAVNALTDVSGTATAGTGVNVNSASQPAAYGPDYVAYSDGAAPGGYYVVKLSGNNPVFSEYATCAPFSPGIATGADEVLPRILSLNGKSTNVASTHQFSLVFYATGVDPKLRQSSPEPLATPVMQSASVGWCISSIGGAPNVKLTRVEMV